MFVQSNKFYMATLGRFLIKKAFVCTMKSAFCSKLDMPVKDKIWVQFPYSAVLSLHFQQIELQTLYNYAQRQVTHCVM